MKNSTRSTLLICMLLLITFFSNIAFAQTTPSISGTVTGLNPCNPYTYSIINIPPNAQNIQFNWENLSLNFDPNSTFQFTTQQIVMYWKNAPDSNTPKKIGCKVIYSIRTTNPNGSITTTPYEHNLTTDVSIKYFSPPSAIALNGSTQTPTTLACGTNSITLAINPVTTEPSTTVNYTWSLPAGWNITSGTGTNSITVVPTAGSGGSISVRVKRSDGTCFLDRDMMINRPTITAIPTITTYSDFLCNDQLQIYANINASDINSYTWETTGVLLINGQTSATTTSSSVLITATGNGYGSVKVKANGACSSSPFSNSKILSNKTTFVSSNPLKENYCPNEVVYFYTDYNNGSFTYQWEVDAPATIISGQNTGGIEVRVPNVEGFGGIARVYITYCGVTFMAQTNYYTVNCGGGGSTETISVFPNPANDEISVSVNENEEGSVELIDKNGKAVIKLPIKKGQPKLTLKTSQLPEGFYTLVLSQGNKIERKQIIIQH